MEQENNYQYLTRINSPADLRALPVEALPTVCAELRSYLIEALAKNPGHFASSLGAVALTVPHQSPLARTAALPLARRK